MPDLTQNTSYGSGSSSPSKTISLASIYKNKSPATSTGSAVSNIKPTTTLTPAPDIQPSHISGETLTTPPDKAIKTSVPSDYKSFYRPEVAPNTRFVQLNKLLGGGQYAESLSPSTDLPLSKRMDTQADTASKREGTSGSLWEIDHIVPLWLKGVDTDENKQMLFWTDHTKKTKVQEVVRSLLNNGKIGEKEALSLSLNWNNYDANDVDTSMVSKSGGTQTVPVDVAEKKFNEWKNGPDMSLTSWTGIKNNLKGFFSGEGNFSKDSLQHVSDTINEKIDSIKNPILNKTLNVAQEAAKGIASAATLGYVDIPTAIDDNDSDAEKVIKEGAKMVGNIGVTIAEFMATGGLIGGVFNGASKLTRAAQLFKTSKGLASAGKLFSNMENGFKVAADGMKAGKTLVAVLPEIAKPMLRDVVISNVLGQAYKQDPSMSRLERVFADTSAAILMDAIPHSTKGLFSRQGMTRLTGVAAASFATNYIVSGDEKSSFEQAALFSALYALGGKGYMQRMEKVGRESFVGASVEHLKPYAAAYRKEVNPTFELKVPEKNAPFAERKAYATQMRKFEGYVMNQLDKNATELGLSDEKLLQLKKQAHTSVDGVRDNFIINSDAAFWKTQSKRWEGINLPSKYTDTLGEFKGVKELPSDQARFLQANPDLLNLTTKIKEAASNVAETIAKHDTGIIDKLAVTGQAMDKIFNENLRALQDRFTRGVQKTDEFFASVDKGRWKALQHLNATDKEILAGKKSPYLVDDALLMVVKNEEKGTYDPIGYIPRSERIGNLVKDQTTGSTTVEGKNTLNHKIAEFQARYPDRVKDFFDPTTDNKFVKLVMDKLGIRVIKGKFLRDDTGQAMVGIGKDSKEPYALFKIDKDDVADSVKRNSYVDYKDGYLKSEKIRDMTTFAPNVGVAEKVLIKEPRPTVNPATVEPVIASVDNNPNYIFKSSQSVPKVSDSISVGKEIIASFINDFKLAIKSGKQQNIIDFGKKYNLDISKKASFEMLRPDNKASFSIEDILPVIEGKPSMVEKVPLISSNGMDILSHWNNITTKDPTFVKAFGGDVGSSLLSKEKVVKNPNVSSNTAPAELATKIGMYTREKNPNIKSQDQIVMKPKEKDFIKSLEEEAKTIQSESNTATEVPRGSLVNGKPVTEAEAAKINNILGGKTTKPTTPKDFSKSGKGKTIEFINKMFQPLIDDARVNKNYAKAEELKQSKNAFTHENNRAEAVNLLNEAKGNEDIAFEAFKNKIADKLEEATGTKPDFTDEKIDSNLKKYFKNQINYLTPDAIRITPEGATIVEKPIKKQNIYGPAYRKADAFEAEHGLESGSLRPITLDKENSAFKDSYNVWNKLKQIRDSFKEIKTGDKKEKLIIVGQGGKDIDSIVAVKYNDKVKNMFNEKDHLLFREKESDLSDETKFLRVYFDKVLNIPIKVKQIKMPDKSIVTIEEATAGDILKRTSQIYQRFTQVTGKIPQSKSTVDGHLKFLVMKSPTVKGTINPEMFKGYNKETKTWATEADKKAFDSKDSGSMFDGNNIMQEYVINHSLKNIGSSNAGHKTGMKPILHGVSSEGIPVTAKQYVTGYDKATREYFKDSLGLDIDKYDGIIFDDNIKIGKFSPGEKGVEINMPVDSIYVRDSGMKEGAIFGNSIVGKIGNKEGVSEALNAINSANSKEFANFVNQIAEKKSGVEIKKVFEDYAEKYGIDTEDLFKGVKQDALELGAGNIYLHQQIGKMLKNIRLEMVDSYTPPRSGKSYIRPNIPLDLDNNGTKRFLKHNEVILSRNDLINSHGLTKEEVSEIANGKKDYYVLTGRNPVTDIKNITKNKVYVGEKYGLKLGDNQSVISNHDALINKEADWDGDSLFVFHIDDAWDPKSGTMPDGVPKVIADAIEKHRDYDILLPSLKKYPKIPITDTNINTLMDIATIGNVMTGKATSFIRILPSLYENKLTVKLSSSGEKNTKVEYFIKGKLIDTKEIPISTRGFSTFDFKQGPKEENIIRSVQQAAIDSMGKEGLVDMVYSKPLAIRSWFKNVSELKKVESPFNDRDVNTNYLLEQIADIKDGGVDRNTYTALNKALSPYQDIFNLSSADNITLGDLPSKTKEFTEFYKKIKAAGGTLSPHQEAYLAIEGEAKYPLLTRKDNEDIIAKNDVFASKKVKDEFKDVEKIKMSDEAWKIENSIKSARVKAGKLASDSNSHKFMKDYKEVYAKNQKEQTDIRKEVVDNYLKAKESGQLSDDDLTALSYFAASSKDGNFKANPRYDNSATPNKYVYRFEEIIHGDEDIASAYYKNFENGEQEVNNGE